MFKMYDIFYSTILLDDKSKVDESIKKKEEPPKEITKSDEKQV